MSVGEEEEVQQRSLAPSPPVGRPSVAIFEERVSSTPSSDAVRLSPTSLSPNLIPRSPQQSRHSFLPTLVANTFADFFASAKSLAHDQGFSLVDVPSEYGNYHELRCTTKACDWRVDVEKLANGDWVATGGTEAHSSHAFKRLTEQPTPSTKKARQLSPPRSTPSNVERSPSPTPSSDSDSDIEILEQKPLPPSTTHFDLDALKTYLSVPALNEFAPLLLAKGFHSIAAIQGIVGYCLEGTMEKLAEEVDENGEERMPMAMRMLLETVLLEKAGGRH